MLNFFKFVLVWTEIWHGRKTYMIWSYGRFSGHKHDSEKQFNNQILFCYSIKTQKQGTPAHVLDPTYKWHVNGDNVEMFSMCACMDWNLKWLENTHAMKLWEGPIREKKNDNF